MNKNIVSKCCKASLKVVEGDEGTNHFECTKCGKAADIYSDDKKEASMTQLENTKKEILKELEQTAYQYFVDVNATIHATRQAGKLRVAMERALDRVEKETRQELISKLEKLPFHAEREVFESHREERMVTYTTDIVMLELSLKSEPAEREG